MRCCGQDRNTPFCPMCARQLQKHPLLDLLKRCIVTEKALTNRSGRCFRLAENHILQKRLEDAEYDKAEAIRLSKVAEKWAAWAVELQKVIGGVESVDDQPEEE